MYRVLIIGAGRIGAFFDNPHSTKIITHAHAFLRHPGFEIVGFLDVNSDAAQRAAALWGGRAFTSLEDAFGQGDIDIVSIASIDETHVHYLYKLCNYAPRLIFLEKPITRNLKEAELIVALYEQSKVPVLVNYSRRFLPQYQQIAHNIKAGTFGSLLHCSLTYGKGLIHNASHALDLLYFFGYEQKPRQVFAYEADYYHDDPSLSGVIELNGHSLLSMNYVSCKSYTVFELDLVFENARVRCLDRPEEVQVFKVQNDPVFEGYRNLELEKVLSVADQSPMMEAIKNIYAHLEEGAPLACSLKDGFQVLKLCHEMRVLGGLAYESSNFFEGSGGGKHGNTSGAMSYEPWA